MSARGAAVLAGLVGTLLWMAPQPAGAASLVDQLDNLFGQDGITLDNVRVNNVLHTAHFSSAAFEQLGALTSKLSAQASDFPAVSTVPGFAYRYDEKLQVFTPVTGSFGSIFVERPETLGKGKFEVGLSYAYVSFKQLNGTDLDKLNFTLNHNDCCDATRPPPSPDFPAFELDNVDVNFQKFDLTSNVITLTGTYGVTDRFDLNLLLPVVYTDMDVRGVATIDDISGTDVHFFNVANAVIQETRSVSDNHLGVGDLQLRSKYRLDSIAGFGTAVGLNFRFPTGSQDNFQGFGDFTLEPYFVTARDFGPINLHAAGGFQIDPQTIDRTRVRYGGGVAWQVHERVALITDVIGSSNITTEEDEIKVPQFTQTNQQSPSSFQTTTTRLNSTIVDVVPGIKVNVAGSAFVFFSAFVPINDSGLRTDFTPIGGVEMSF
jgi:Putative MetA-pathway of phenol degradation